MNMQEAFDKLTPEEVDLLNSDPQMLNDFKTKYGTSTYDRVVGAAQQMYKQSNPVQSMIENVADQTLLVFDKGGVALTEALSQNSPNKIALPAPVAAGLGTAAQMVPYGVMATEVMPGVPAMAKSLEKDRKSVV